MAAEAGRAAGCGGAAGRPLVGGRGGQRDGGCMPTSNPSLVGLAGVEGLRVSQFNAPVQSILGLGAACGVASARA